MFLPRVQFGMVFEVFLSRGVTKEKNMKRSIASRFWGNAINLVAMVVCGAALSSFAVDLPAPMVWYTMTDMSGTTVADASGNGHNLTLGAGVEVVDVEIGGKALKFSGTTADWAKFTCPAVTNTTIAFWLCREATDTSIIQGGAEKNTIPYILSTGYSGYGINWQRNALALSFINQANNPQSNFNSFATPARAVASCGGHGGTSGDG